MRMLVHFTVSLLATVAQIRAAPAASQLVTPLDRTAASAAVTASTSPETSTNAGPKAETARVKRVRLPALPTLAASAEYKLLDSAGKQVGRTAGSAGAIDADVAPGKPYVLVPPGRGRQAASLAKLEFPARYLTFDKNGEPLNDGGLFLRPLNVPLVWNDQARAYTTELIVGYDFKDGHERPLAAPKTVAFFAEGSDVQIQADTVVINHSGTGGYQRVVLSTHQVQGETLFTARASPVDELQASVAIQREPGRLDISLPAGQIDAFGLGTGTLAVTLLARDGQPLAAPNSLAIHLSSRRLRLPPSVTLAAGQSSTAADFRSLGYGTDEIVAEVGSLKASLPVRVVLPVAAALAAIIGGALGGAARYLRNKGRKASLLVRRLIEGMLAGVLFVGAAWAGLVTVDVTAGVLGTPFGAFVLAGLSGYVGCVVLDRVADRTFRALKPT
ncbi:MAG TPA: hypothetical protein VLW52_05890 [Opitutaceae bacterium]|nr:hypothetical protein [Opitutaceae bacterium]